MGYLDKLSNDDSGESRAESGSDVSQSPDVGVGSAPTSEVTGGFLEKLRNKKVWGFLVLILILAVGAFSAYSYWSWNSSDQTAEESGEVSELEKLFAKERDPSINEGPKTEPSPVNGVLYTEERANIWRQRRVMGVVIENHVASRPAYGLNDAELIYEAVAEGGITRFVAFYLANQAERLEPIRSARNYFLDWVGDYDSLFVHHGGANSQNPKTDALGNIGRYGIASLDCIRGGGLCERDSERYAPHNSMADTASLWKAAEKMDLNEPTEFNAWKFKDDIPESERPASQDISFNFWDDPDYFVRWEYDPQSNTYLRFNGDGGTSKQIDANYNEQVRAKNIILQETPQRVVDDGTPYPHLTMDTIGSGNATIFRDGQKIDGTWEKESRTSRTMYFNSAGEEIEFNRGQIWIEVLPVGNVVTVN